MRSTAEARYYREITEDFVGMLKVQGGQMFGNDLLITDQFFLGPSLVRGFAPSGIGPRDAPMTRATTPWVARPTSAVRRKFSSRSSVSRASWECGAPCSPTPARLFGYKGGTNFSSIAPYSYCPGGSSSTWTKQPTCLSVIDSHEIRTSVGASLLWQSPLGPIRFDYAYPLTKNKYDQTQYFRFSGGTSF